MVQGLGWGIREYFGIYRDNAKENGNDYITVGYIYIYWAYSRE